MQPLQHKCMPTADRIGVQTPRNRATLAADPLEHWQIAATGCFALPQHPMGMGGADNEATAAALSSVLWLLLPCKSCPRGKLGSAVGPTERP